MSNIDLLNSASFDLVIFMHPPWFPLLAMQTEYKHIAGIVIDDNRTVDVTHTYSKGQLLSWKLSWRFWFQNMVVKAIMTYHFA